MTDRKCSKAFYLVSDLSFDVGWIISQPDRLLEIQWFIKGAPPGRDGSLRTA